MATPYAPPPETPSSPPLGSPSSPTSPDHVAQASRLRSSKVGRCSISAMLPSKSFPLEGDAPSAPKPQAQRAVRPAPATTQNMSIRGTDPTAHSHQSPCPVESCIPIPSGSSAREVRSILHRAAIGRTAASTPLSPISDLPSPARSAPSAIRPQSSVLGRFAAFTLIELLVVITIIGILAGLVLAAMGGIQKQSFRTKAQSEIQALSAAIEEYHRDRGTYPPTNSNALYAELTTDRNAGHTPANTTKVYFEPTPTIVNTNTPGQKFFQDPWDAAYLYRTSGDDLRNRGFFDIYSKAGEADSSKFIWNAP